MTANGTAKTPAGILTAIMAWFQSALRVIGRIALGGLALLAAGILAIAMAVIGVLITLAALIFRVTKGAPHKARRAPAGQAGQASPDGGVILEARKTGQGWTVE